MMIDIEIINNASKNEYDDDMMKEKDGIIYSGE